MTEDRIRLESKIATLERTVDALSGELAAQQKQIEWLTRHIELLVEQIKRQRSGGDDPIEPHDTRPPHWGG